MSWPYLVLLALALVLLVGAEWQRVAGGRGVNPRGVEPRDVKPRGVEPRGFKPLSFGAEARNARSRQKRKSNLKLVRTESDDFAESVERDLAELPTIDEKDRRR